VELILSVLLVALLAGTSFWILFLQTTTYAETTRRADAMARLASTWQLMLKELREQSWNEVKTDTHTTFTRIATGPVAPPLFEYDGNGRQILWKGSPVLDQVLATFSVIASLSVLDVSLQSAQAEECSLRFLVAPRNQ